MRIENVSLLQQPPEHARGLLPERTRTPFVALSDQKIPPPVELPPFIRALWDPIATPIAGAAGVLLAHLWQRYLGRLATLRWSAWHHRIATAGDAPTIGRVDVMWNGAPVTNLHWCAFEIENESSKDLANAEVKLAYRDGSNFLTRGTPIGTAQFLPYGPLFDDAVARVQGVPPEQQPADDVQFLLTNRHFVIPVFNRGTKITVTFLVHATTIQPPTLTAAVDHIGVRLRQQSERPSIFGVEQRYAAGVGLTAGIGVALLLAAFIPSWWGAALAAFVVGAYGQLLGVALVKLKRVIARTIG